MGETKNVTYVNLGPQHPAAHGVLRIVMKMEGEEIKKVDTHIGLLHRGTEKLIEYKTYNQGLPYMDRLDYVSMMAQEHCWSLGVEKITGLRVRRKEKEIRVMYSEITRILNHILAVTTHALDVGAMTPFLWGFVEREHLMELYERVSGGRMHASYIRPGGVRRRVKKEIKKDIKRYVRQIPTRMGEIETLLSGNKIFKERLRLIGVVPWKIAETYALTGVMLRGSGIPYDIRKNEPYELYNELTFKVGYGKNGDSYTRYKVRMTEIKESTKLIEQLLLWIS